MNDILIDSFSLDVRPLAGDAVAPGFVFVSGLFAGTWPWDGVWDRLPADAPAARFVEPLAQLNNGQTRSVEKLTAAIVRGIEDSGITRPILCANSLGAMVVVNVAVAYPDRVSGIVVSGAPGIGPEGKLAHVPQRSRAYVEALVRNIVHNPDRVDDGRIAEACELFKHSEPAHNVFHGLRLGRRYPMKSALKRVECPALYVWGKQDRVTSASHWENAVASLTNTRVHVVDDAGHSPMLEQPDEFADLLRTFRTEVGAHERQTVAEGAR